MNVPDRLPTPIAVVLAAVYDQVIELGEGTTDPEDFHHRFWGHLTRVELAMLKGKGDMVIPVYHHPLPAMKTYRSFMCGASIYEGLGDAKLRIRDFDTFEIRYWKCPYSELCGSRKTVSCMRSHSLSEAAELLSPVTFEEIEDLQFSEAGNCKAFVRFHFTGDLRDISQEDRTIDERPCLHLTREEAETFLLRTIMAGAEYSCVHLPEVNTRRALRDIADSIDKVDLEERYFHEFPMLKRGLAHWRKGKNAFVQQE
jgi:hypothetical protein